MIIEIEINDDEDVFPYKIKKVNTPLVVGCFSSMFEPDTEEEENLSLQQKAVEQVRKILNPYIENYQKKMILKQAEEQGQIKKEVIER